MLLINSQIMGYNCQTICRPVLCCVQWAHVQKLLMIEEQCMIMYDHACELLINFVQKIIFLSHFVPFHSALLVIQRATGTHHWRSTHIYASVDCMHACVMMYALNEWVLIENDAVVCVFCEDECCCCRVSVCMSWRVMYADCVYNHFVAYVVAMEKCCRYVCNNISSSHTHSHSVDMLFLHTHEKERTPPISTTTHPFTLIFIPYHHYIYELLQP